MRKMFVVFSNIIFCFFLAGVCIVFAQEETTTGVQQAEATTNAQQETSGTDWKQELNSDKQQIEEQHKDISQNMQEARAEEDQLKQQIKVAMDSGDTQTADQLKEQLKAVHQENMQGKKQDMQEMQAAKKDFKNDVNEAKQEGYLPPKGDKDNNPPGPKGGPGTNWENLPGAEGGPGASPDRKPPMIDKDNNPPGPKGGPGSNWENKPGPKGGPGASPNKEPKMKNPWAGSGKPQVAPQGGSPRGGDGKRN